MVEIIQSAAVIQLFLNLLQHSELVQSLYTDTYTFVWNQWLATCRRMMSDLMYCGLRGRSTKLISYDFCDCLCSTCIM